MKPLVFVAGMTDEEMDAIEENERVRAVFMCAIDVGRHSARVAKMPEESEKDVGYRLLRAASCALGVKKDGTPVSSKELSDLMDQMVAEISREHAMWIADRLLEGLDSQGATKH